MTEAELRVIAKGLAPVLRTLLARELAPVLTRVAALEQTASDVTRTRVRMLGEWTTGRAYVAGDGVTRDGALWRCEAPSTVSAPGDGLDWLLLKGMRR